MEGENFSKEGTEGAAPIVGSAIELLMDKYTDIWTDRHTIKTNSCMECVRELVTEGVSFSFFWVFREIALWALCCSNLPKVRYTASLGPMGMKMDGRDKLQRPKRMKLRHTKAPPPKRMQGVINRRTGGKQSILFFFIARRGLRRIKLVGSSLSYGQCRRRDGCVPVGRARGCGVAEEERRKGRKDTFRFLTFLGCFVLLSLTRSLHPHHPFCLLPSLTLSPS